MFVWNRGSGYERGEYLDKQFVYDLEKWRDKTLYQYFDDSIESKEMKLSFGFIRNTANNNDIPSDLVHLIHSFVLKPLRFDAWNDKSWKLSANKSSITMKKMSFNMHLVDIRLIIEFIILRLNRNDIRFQKIHGSGLWLEESKNGVIYGVFFRFRLMKLWSMMMKTAIIMVKLKGHMN
eukprot:438695_1